MVRFRIINHISSKIKVLGGYIDRADVYVFIIVILTGVSCFFLGRILKIEADRLPVTIEMRNEGVDTMAQLKPIPGVKIQAIEP